MTTKQLIISSLTRFKDLKSSRDVPFWKAIIYLLALSIIMALPISYQISQVLRSIHSDGQQIAEKIPDFTIEDGKIHTEKKEGFIYQTNSIIFTFDPEGKRTSKDVATDLMGNFISFGLLKDELVIALPNSGLTSSLFGDNTLEVSYTNETLQGFDGTQLRNMLGESAIPFWVKIVVFLAAIYPSFLNLLFLLIMGTFSAYIYARLRLTRATFLECAKTMIYSFTLPVLISTVLLVFLPTFDTTMFILFAGLFIFIQAAREWPKVPIGK
ncbi:MULTISPECIES: DUF1189 domain-containing protein [unclassified Enterococcus]|jgi:maltodextrin utilization protein YvdJ|uniref:DUF1189 domain-containing protein n=1 Tax=unclassified Enterococcus TaxID=2608891 RepID=UPI0003534287|nr:hypothetical protein D920_01289 [Enterococcus faecalis 13-SD-W-01]